MAANQSFGIRVQILLLLALAAVAKFVIGDLGILVHQLEVPAFLEGFAEQQQKLSQLAGNMLLVVSALTLAALLPGLVRKRPERRLLLDEGLVLGSLALLGSLGAQALAGKGQALAVANLILALMAVLSALRVILSSVPLVSRIVVSLLVLATALPQLWRAALEFSSESDHGLVQFLREAADHSLVIAWALTAWFLVEGMTKTRRLIAVSAGLVVIALLAFCGDKALHILATITGLWFSSWPEMVTIALVGLGVTGLTSALIGKNRMALGLAFLLLACSGFRPSGAAELLIQAAAIILCGHWAEGRGRHSGDLAQTLF